MIVVSDTSPLTALLTVGHEDILPQFFDEVFIPKAVKNELLRSHNKLPEWLRTVKSRILHRPRNTYKL